MKKFSIFLGALMLVLTLGAQTPNTSPLPAGETVIGGHLHAGAGNEVWTDAGDLYFNYRGSASATHFWNLAGGAGKSIMTLKNNGNVGIGTYSPTTSLEIAGATTINSASPGNNYLLFKNNGTHMGIIGSDASISGSNPTNMGMYVYGNNSLEFWTYNTKRLVISGSGSVGIGISLPGEKLEINGNLKFTNNGSKIFLGTNDYIQFTDGDKDGFKFVYDDSERLRITNYGNVLIGKNTQSNTSYKLDVAGKIRAHEIVVNTTGADFVFEPTYKLRSLSELETFIRTNKHLPDIAPAKEMQQNGVSAGEMQAKLLQKVEELTLYVIEQSKQIETLKSENNQLKLDKGLQLKVQQELNSEFQKTIVKMKKEIESLKRKINNYTNEI